ncbi:hypothetical protein TWF192_007586 [Orbilia oligospora]|uniref:Uncharacterized protein n=1 Tax=Orbilia oligospora TaxID=2813651 RepID=A0A6G1M5C5_ORBOL|nr:hypothetical protein TWF191_009043 [Orbilia oligospora]KAF3245065.1 hypothetical protein TWF192_007586 [Orbilia oligospora]
MAMEEDDPRRISFYRVAIKIDGAEVRLHKANVKLKLCGQDKYSQTLKVFWTADRFRDQTHKVSNPSTTMRYRSHFLPHGNSPPLRPLYAYGLEMNGGVIISGAAGSKNGFTLITRRSDIAAVRQETSGPVVDGRRLMLIENWCYHGKFPPGWIDIPHLNPDTISGFVTFEFRPFYSHENLSWEEKWETSFPRIICIHNDWSSFWWEGFSNINVPLSRIAGNPTATQSTATLITSRFASYPRPNPAEERATQTSPKARSIDDGTALSDNQVRDDTFSDVPSDIPSEGPSAPIKNSLTMVPDVSAKYAPTIEELLEQASDVFIRAKLLELKYPEDIWNYSP